MTTTKTWKQLRGGDVIICPGDGRTERVLHNRPYVLGKRAVRTSRHDHFIIGSSTVAVKEEE